MDAQAIMDGIWKAVGFLFVGGLVLLSYGVGKNDFDLKKAVKLENAGAVLKRAAKGLGVVAIIALIAASMLGQGGCDSDGDNCTDSYEVSAAQRQTDFSYVFLLLGVPFLLGNSAARRETVQAESDARWAAHEAKERAEWEAKKQAASSNN